MTSRRARGGPEGYFRATYALEVAAALAMIAGLFLPWYEGAARYDAFDLFGITTALLSARDPAVLGQPLIVL